MMDMSTRRRIKGMRAMAVTSGMGKEIDGLPLTAITEFQAGLDMLYLDGHYFVQDLPCATIVYEGLMAMVAKSVYSEREKASFQAKARQTLDCASYEEEMSIKGRIIGDHIPVLGKRYSGTTRIGSALGPIFTSVVTGVKDLMWCVDTPNTRWVWIKTTYSAYAVKVVGVSVEEPTSPNG